ncbi:MAG: hypothetical protein NTW21_26175 [Verrucomicrobia bacterium]|nr:hypothetical protein [Verrucomicrobiota bacterium]
MDWILLIIILVGLALIDSTVRKILKSQDEHNQKVVALLSEIRDKQASK